MKLLNRSLILLLTALSLQLASAQTPERRSEASPHRQRFIEKFDKDGDGELSESERAQAREVIRKHRGVVKKRMAKVRRRLMLESDSNHDGKISLEEKRAAKIIIKERMDEITAEILREYDADGNGKLSKKEHRRAHQQEKKKVLEQFDTDADGKLNKAERKKAFESLLENQPYRLMHQLLAEKRRRFQKSQQRSPEKRGKRWDSSKNDK